MSDIIETLSNVVLAGSAFWAAYVARAGLRIWKAQLNHEHARRILEAAVGIQNRIVRLRTTGYSAGDLDLPLRELWAKTESELSVAAAAAILEDLVHGTHVESTWKQFDEVVWDYIKALKVMEHVHADAGYAERHRKEIDEWESTCWSTGLEDTFTPRLVAAMKELRESVKPLLGQ